MKRGTHWGYSEGIQQNGRSIQQNGDNQNQTNNPTHRHYVQSVSTISSLNLLLNNNVYVDIMGGLADKIVIAKQLHLHSQERFSNPHSIRI